MPKYFINRSKTPKITNPIPFDAIVPARKAPPGQRMITPAQPYTSSASQFQTRAVPKITPTAQGYSIAAQAVADVFACSLIRAQAIAHIPIKVVKTGTDIEVPASPWGNAVAFAQKHFHQNLIFKHEWSLSIWGSNYELKLVQDDRMTPGGLQWLNPQAIEIEDNRGYIEYFEYQGVTETIKYWPRQIGYNYYPNPDSDTRGLSPLRAALSAVNIIRNSAAYIEAFYANDASVGGIISGRSRSAAFGNAPMPMTENDRKTLMEMWEAQTQGARKSFRTILLPLELEYTQFEGKPPTEQVELTDAERRDIHKVMRVPMSLTYASDVADPLSAGSTLSRQQANFWESFVIPEHENIILYYNINIMPWLAPGHELVGDYSKILAAISDTAERRDMLRADVNAGLMTYNQYQEEIGRDTIPGGDVLYLPAGAIVTPVSQLGAPPKPEPAPMVIESEAPPPALSLPESFSRPWGKDASKTFIFDRQPLMDELGRWLSYMKKRQKSGAKTIRPYRPEGLPEHWIQEVSAALEKAGTDREAIKAVFQEARDTYRSISDRLQSFERTFTALLKTAMDDKPISKDRFRRTLLAEVKRFGQLFFSEGLIDGGVLDGRPDNDEQKLLNGLLAPFTAFVRLFATEVYSGRVSSDQARHKPTMWSNKLMKLYQEGLSSANGNLMLLFTGDDGEESCRTCRALKGQIHRAKDWRRRELRPGIDGENFQCGAWTCMHILKPVQAAARGTLPTTAQIRAWAAKACEHEPDYPDFDQQPYTMDEYEAYYRTFGFTEVYRRDDTWDKPGNTPLLQPEPMEQPLVTEQPPL